MRTLVPLAATLLLLTSCGAVERPGDDAPDLEGHTFLSTGVTEDGSDRPLVDGSRLRLTFEDGRLSAQAGCNTMSGGYRTEDGRLVVEQLAMTQMGCPEELMEQDAWLADLLGGGPTVEADGDGLVLTSGSTVVTLLDRVVADPDRPLADTVWRVESLISGDAVSSTPGEAEASLTFHEDGTLEVDAGCNRGASSWSADGDTVTLGAVGLTRMACDDDRSALERAVMEVLEAVELQVEISADRLTLTGEDGKALGLRAD